LRRAFDRRGAPEKEKQMVAVTYGVARVPVVEAAAKTERKEAAAPRKRWFARFIQAMMDARLEQARRELRMHTQLLPYSFEERNSRLVKTRPGDMPFQG
jgi:hypothetical protein